MTVRLRRDDGSAVVEFCLLSVLMLVPLVYLVAVLGRVQAAALAAQTAAREAGRAFVTAPDDESADQRAQAAAAIAFDDQGFGEQGTGTVELTCAANPCLVPDARIAVRTRVLELLPGVPRVLDRVVPTRIEVAARQVVTADRFRQPPQLAESAPDSR
jgi:Flp pilus assembly protein TadG